MAVLGPRPCVRAFSSCGKWGPLFIVVCGPPTNAASLVAEHRLQMRRLSNCGSRAQLLRGMWESSQTRTRTRAPCMGRQTLNHCVTREALFFSFVSCVFGVIVKKILARPMLSSFSICFLLGFYVKSYLYVFNPF